jgi:hypothetical protein
MPHRVTADPHKTRMALNYLKLGYRDYIGARSLLFAGLPLQGAQFASTAVEKYLKTVMAMRGNSTKGHLGRAIINSIAQYEPSLIGALNPSFLELLIRCYTLRYEESLTPGFNLALASTSLLAELDYSIATIQKRFTFTRAGGERLQTPYEFAESRQDPRLTGQNYLFMGLQKHAFVEANPPHCYELRVDNTRGILEAEYIAEKDRWDDNFLIEGLRPDKGAGA